MIKILIVDDEQIIREGLRKIISENCTDFEIVGEASNGRNALELSLNSLPEIVITDIRMPIMDGLEYFRRVKEHLPKIKVIILSGYADFTYAKEAMNLGGSFYCLKPIKHGELISQLSKLKEEIISERQKAESEAGIQNSIKESKVQKRNLFLNALIKNELSNNFSVFEKMKSYKLEFLCKEFYLVTVDVDDFYINIKRQSYDVDDNRDFLSFTIIHKIQEVIDGSKELCGVVFSSSLRETVVLLSKNSDSINEKDLTVKKLLSKVQEVLLKHQDISVTIGYYGYCRNISMISNAYECARVAVQERFKNGRSKIFYYQEIQPEVVAYPFKEESELITSLKNGEKPDIMMHLNNTIKYFLDSKINREECISMFCRMYMTVQQHLVSLKAPGLLQSLPSHSNFEKHLLKMDFFHDMRTYLHDIFDKICEDSKMIYNDSTRKVVKMARDYVEKNYNKDISLYDVALYVNLNPNYLSVLFKNETGDTFTDYQIKLKIDRAKTLLRDSTLKTHEIALMVGYHDSKHFSKIFKKFAGCTPTEYREMSVLPSS